MHPAAIFTNPSLSKQLNPSSYPATVTIRLWGLQPHVKAGSACVLFRLLLSFVICTIF